MLKVLAFMLLLASLPVSALAQENPDGPMADTAPADVAPNPDGPWWMWHSDELPLGAQAFGGIAYSTFWARRTEALGNPSLDLELDLTAVLDGQPLANELAALHALEAKGQAQVVVVENRPVVVYANDHEFVIYDAYVDRSYLVDARSRAPVGSGPNVEPHEVRMAYHIRQTFDPDHPGAGFWKVVDAVRITN